LNAPWFGEYALSNLARRLKKLEALLTDGAGLVPGSPQWLAYWTHKVDKILNAEEEVKGCLIPLEVVDVIIQSADVRGGA
jgi:hypothetical protein